MKKWFKRSIYMLVMGLCFLIGYRELYLQFSYIPIPTTSDTVVVSDLPAPSPKEAPPIDMDAVDAIMESILSERDALYAQLDSTHNKLSVAKTEEDKNYYREEIKYLEDSLAKIEDDIAAKMNELGVPAAGAEMAAEEPDSYGPATAAAPEDPLSGTSLRNGTIGAILGWIITKILDSFVGVIRRRFKPQVA